MDFSKLDQNEKLAVYGSVVTVIAGLISTYGGLMWLAVLAAIGMLVVVFLPQLSAGTTLPGSKGTLMAALGLLAIASAVITLLQWMSVIGLTFGSFATIMLIVAVIGAAVMAWAGWQELQREGGKWRFGAETGAPPAGTTAPPPAMTDTASAPPPPPASVPPPVAAPPADSDVPPTSSYDEDPDRPRDA